MGVPNYLKKAAEMKQVFLLSNRYKKTALTRGLFV